MPKKFKPLHSVDIEDKNICIFLSEILSSENDLLSKYDELYNRTYLYEESEEFMKLRNQSELRAKKIKKIIKNITCESQLTKEDIEKFEYYTSR